MYMPSPSSADDILDDLAHFRHLAVHALCKGDEVLRAVEILGLVLCLEVFVAGKIVIQISGGELESHDQAAVREAVDFILRKQILGVGQEALGKCLKHFHIQTNLVELEAGRSHGVAGGADCITEIVACKTGHDCIQINDADGLAGIGVEEDVVDLGVVVGYTKRDAAGLIELVEDKGLVSHGEHVGHFGRA